MTAPAVPAPTPELRLAYISGGRTHAALLDRPAYSGMTAQTLCQVRAHVSADPSGLVDTNTVRQITCSRCARALATRNIHVPQGPDLDAERDAATAWQRAAADEARRVRRAALAAHAADRGIPGQAALDLADLLNESSRMIGPALAAETVRLVIAAGWTPGAVDTAPARA